jgi:hypothetical protein
LAAVGKSDDSEGENVVGIEVADTVVVGDVGSDEVVGTAVKASAATAHAVVLVAFDFGGCWYLKQNRCHGLQSSFLSDFSFSH